MLDAVTERMFSVWGDVFELAVKRGILSFLIQTDHLSPAHPELQPWLNTKIRKVREHCLYQAEAVSDHAIHEVRSYCDHLLHVGYGIGWTTGRRYWQSLPARENFEVSALWCPLDMKDRTRELSFDGDEAAVRFSKAFGLDNLPGLSNKGWPARADFLIQLVSTRSTRLMCMEFSLNVPASQANFDNAISHRNEISRYSSLVSARGVFSSISSEVSDMEGRFHIAPEMVKHMRAFTSSDKPLYKLMQGCSYASNLAKLTSQAKKLEVDVIAVTGAGVERINAPFGLESEGSVKRKTVEAMGQVYRQTGGSSADEMDFSDRLDRVYRQIRKGLPTPFKKDFEKFLTETTPGEVQTSRILEEVKGFRNPQSPIQKTEACAWLSDIPDDELTRSFLGSDAAALIDSEVANENYTLRNLNAAAIHAAVKATKPGEMKVLGLLGHPGIGKTTSVVHLFKKMTDGVLFAYFSPRVVINGDVTTSVVKECGEGSFAVTTNSHLIGVSPEWGIAQGISKEVTGAVCIETSNDDVVSRPHSEGAILHLLKEEAQEASEGNYVRKNKKRDLDMRTSRIEQTRTPRVLRTLASETGWLMRKNPGAPVVAVTAAIQGFRMSGSSSTTVEDLRSIFEHKHDTQAGIDERRALAKVRPLVVVMIDEITGDAAGAPMVHATAEWLRSEFIDPFPEGQSPFRVALILADASLATPETFSSYMGSTRKTGKKGALYEDAPARVMISPADRTIPFGVKAGKVTLGAAKEDILYVMADAYPARKLEIEYKIRLDRVDMTNIEDTKARERERSAHSDRMRRAAISAIREALERHPKQQVIYFAQDKLFLDEIRNTLVAEGMEETRVASLHSSIDAEKRRMLVRSEVRDHKDVFLMTSAGSRGVSFPKAATIIIQVPRFEIETSLMEIGQMIFRGRGWYEENGSKVDGDQADRRIVFMIEDYVRTDGDGGLDKIHWAARKIDLATIAVLLRATVETRIKGYTSSPGFKGSVIPVGRIGLDLTSDSLTGSLATLLKECRVASASKELEIRGAAKMIEQLIIELYGNFKLSGRYVGMTSFVNSDQAERFSMDVCSPSASLVREKGVNPTVPDNAYFCGPCIYESWDDVLDLKEQFHHGVGTTEKRQKLHQICRSLYRHRDAPKKLRDAAFRVSEMTSRANSDLEHVEFSVEKGMASKGMWLVIPADWTRFVADRNGTRDTRGRKISAPELWLDTMRQAMSLHRAPTEMFPIIPDFVDKPFAAAQSLGDPTGMDSAFDARYFFSSTEFNLLNIILHGSRSDE
jgi:Superfamily II DNA and RNA helicases